MDLARPPHRRRLAVLAFALIAASVSLLAIAVGSAAQDLQSQLEHKQAQLEDTRAREGVLSTTIQRYSSQIETLAGQVATLRNREAAVQADIEDAQAKLRIAVAKLERLQKRLDRSVAQLKQRLIAIYKSDEPDVLNVILDSEGFDDLVSRYEYLRTIEQRDNQIVSRVRDLRDETRATVREIRALRDELVAKRAELVRTRTQLESRQQALDAARSRQRDTLSKVQATEAELEGDVSDIQAEIQAQIQAAEASQPPAVSGPVPGSAPGPESSSGFIWPVNGPVTSPFCEQRSWESCHPGIDIAVPAGTPIRAAASGTVILLQSEASSGGYGNFTCIEHGGGLSTCYAHQSSFATSQGASVSQGQVIGYVGCTGLCFGDHLHFEVRVNGSPVDPMGYLP